MLSDPLIGSVHGIARDGGGAPLKKYDLNAWGRVPTADTGVVTRFRMAGREYDPESGLYYMRARYYDPEEGRFLSEDPAGLSGGSNLYRYAANDPVNNTHVFGTGVDCKRVKVDDPDVMDWNTWTLTTNQYHWESRCTFTADAGPEGLATAIETAFRKGSGLGGTAKRPTRQELKQAECQVKA